jgi:hypothetical protein
MTSSANWVIVEILVRGLGEVVVDVDVLDRIELLLFWGGLLKVVILSLKMVSIISGFKLVVWRVLLQLLLLVAILVIRSKILLWHTRLLLCLLWLLVWLGRRGLDELLVLVLNYGDLDLAYGVKLLNVLDVRSVLYYLLRVERRNLRVSSLVGNVHGRHIRLRLFISWLRIVLELRGFYWGSAYFYFDDVRLDPFVSEVDTTFISHLLYVEHNFEIFVLVNPVEGVLKLLILG